MPQEINCEILPDMIAKDEQLKSIAAQKLGIEKESISQLRIVRKSIDARKRPVKLNLKIQVYLQGEEIESVEIVRDYRDVSKAKHVVIIGAGPGGLFAALKLIENGIKPVIIERGKSVRERRRDLVSITRNEGVDSDSNYCFGEGGAGTYSDGKLYTRSKKRGSVNSILETLVYHGANKDILVNSHPHIGTNKLPQVIETIRETILNSGGEIHFESSLKSLIINEGAIEGIELSNSRKLSCKKVILATGHSARDIYYMLERQKVAIEFKSFALGVRVEHSQKLIDKIQYKCEDRGEFLPPASYSLVHQIDGRGVYSFCMCPGGVIAPCATDKEEIVTNGWSPSKRNNPFANSGIVVPVHWEDITSFHKYGGLAGLEFQKSVERACWEAGGKSQIAPAQRLLDFVNGRLSKTLPECSYKPGLKSARLDHILPQFIANRLKSAFKVFDKKMRGFLNKDAIVVGPESRTSSPVRIPRDRESLMHPELIGLYPCGEGAGYAGGIVSAAIDGEKIALACLEHTSAI